MGFPEVVMCLIDFDQRNPTSKFGEHGAEATDFLRMIENGQIAGHDCNFSSSPLHPHQQLGGDRAAGEGISGNGRESLDPRRIGGYAHHGCAARRSLTNQRRDFGERTGCEDQTVAGLL